MVKKHKCFGSLLKADADMWSDKAVCNWSNTAFMRCEVLRLVYIAAAYVVCEHHAYLTFWKQLGSISADQSIETRTVPANLTLSIRCYDAGEPNLLGWCWICTCQLMFNFFLAGQLLESSTLSSAVVSGTEAPEPCVQHRIRQFVMWALAEPQAAKLSLASQLACFFSVTFCTSVFRM